MHIKSFCKMLSITYNVNHQASLKWNALMFYVYRLCCEKLKKCITQWFPSSSDTGYPYIFELCSILKTAQVLLIKLQLFQFTVFSSSSSSFRLLLLSLLFPFLVWLVVKHVAKHYHPILCFTLLVNFTPTQYHQFYTYFWNIW